jgi:hypothetical protein
LGAVKLGGVTRVTVFEETDDATGRVELKPVAERLVFRRPGERLKLHYATNGTFTPGARVNLTVRATDENDQPKPAIVMTAVVNENGRAMANDTTGQLLPTYFLLSGEVRHGDDLEHADFLLTDQPGAAATLDLLLGTQGWRRFAEQAPHLFRSRVPAEEANRLLMAMDVRGGPMPSSWRSETRRVFDEYWPKYESAVLRLEEAENERRSDAARDTLQQDLLQAQGRYSARIAEFGRALADLDYFNRSVETRRLWLPITLLVTFGAGVLLVVVSFSRGTPSERRVLRWGGIGFFALGLLIVVVVIGTTRGGDRWKAWAALAPKPNRGWMGPTATKMPAPAAPPKNGAAAVQAVAPPQFGGADQANPAAIRRRPGVAKTMRLAPRVAHVMAPARLGSSDRFNQLKERFAASESVERHPEPVPAAPHSEQVRPAPGPAQRLPFDLQKARDVIGTTTPNGQTADQALATILQNVPRAQPLIVRQYAHTRPTPARPDFAETLLWNPVLVLPRDGQATLTFDLSDAEAAYQILVAGHTLNGRIGGIVGTIEVRKPK